MPELPEVETIRRTLAPQLRGRRIERVRVHWARTAVPDPTTLRRWLTGRRFAELARRGKYLVARLGSPQSRRSRCVWLLVHLRMSGRLELVDPVGPSGRHVRVELWLDDGRRLRFEDARKFGRWIATPDPRPWLDALGPDALDPRLTARRLAARLRSRRRMLKPLLLDQRVLAGLGNIYADEALFAAGLHPLRRSDTLGEDEIRRLHRAMRDVLRRAIRHSGTRIDWIYPEGRMQAYLRVYGRGGQPCVRCGEAIARLRVAQRSTYICPRCQRPIVASGCAG